MRNRDNRLWVAVALLIGLAWAARNIYSAQVTMMAIGHRCPRPPIQHPPPAFMEETFAGCDLSRSLDHALLAFLFCLALELITLLWIWWKPKP